MRVHACCLYQCDHESMHVCTCCIYMQVCVGGIPASTSVSICACAGQVLCTYFAKVASACASMHTHAFIHMHVCAHVAHNACRSQVCIWVGASPVRMRCKYACGHTYGQSMRIYRYTCIQVHMCTGVRICAPMYMDKGGDLSITKGNNVLVAGQSGLENSTKRNIPFSP